MAPLLAMTCSGSTTLERERFVCSMKHTFFSLFFMVKKFLKISHTFCTLPLNIEKLGSTTALGSTTTDIFFNT